MADKPNPPWWKVPYRYVATKPVTITYTVPLNAPKVQP